MLTLHGFTSATELNNFHSRKTNWILIAPSKTLSRTFPVSVELHDNLIVEAEAKPDSVIIRRKDK